jgi:hypothetical protein
VTPGGYANVTIDYNGCKTMTLKDDKPLKGTPLHIRAKIRWHEQYGGSMMAYLDYKNDKVNLQVWNLMKI